MLTRHHRMRLAALSCAVIIVPAMICMAGDVPPISATTSRPASDRAASVVIEADDLPGRLASTTGTPILLLDVRDAAAYAAGHLSGAVRVDPGEWKKESLSAENGLSHEEFWRQQIGKLGVSGREGVIIYDDGRMTEAARVWFILQHFGVAEVGVVNGGYPALEPLVTSEKLATSRTPTVPRPATLRPSRAGSAAIDLVERKKLREMIDAGKLRIMDVRTGAEFSGEDLRGNPRGGHLPTAFNLPHSKLLDRQGHLLAREKLIEVFRASGVEPNQRIVTHCDGGGRASLAALAAHSVGYGPVVNYYLSFGDWSRDATCPVERPASQPAESPSKP